MKAAWFPSGTIKPPVKPLLPTGKLVEVGTYTPSLVGLEHVQPGMAVVLHKVPALVLAGDSNEKLLIGMKNVAQACPAKSVIPANSDALKSSLNEFGRAIF